jgi:hypothetical protein
LESGFLEDKGEIPPVPFLVTFAPDLIYTACISSLQVGTKLNSMDNNTQTNSTLWKTPADEFFQ